MLALSNYHLKENLYQGKRTEVYRGIRESDRQPVIIKILRNPHPNFNELVQFRNQYVITGHMEDTHIVKPIALERYGNGYALVMPDDEAIALSDYWPQAERNLGEFLSIAIQLADALHYLGVQRIIHKDIKPANILICPNIGQVKLIDFSISSLLPKEQQQLISPNVLEGTLAYISPEQTGRMNRGIDYRTDFYSLGVTFFELLTGKLPFATSDPMELVHCHIAKMPLPLGNWEWGIENGDPSTPLRIKLGMGNWEWGPAQEGIGNGAQRPAQEGREIPEAIENIVMKLMEKNAEDRYQSALGLKYDLERCLQEWEAKGEIALFELGENDRSDRFLIPEKLYGREKEAQQLLAAFDRVAAGNTEMMLVAGFSGIGKTAVVSEVHKPIVEARGYFIKGKFDQFNRNIPLSAFAIAFRDLMGQLLGESDAQLANWKAKILEALGESGQVIIDVIPELELIVGQQPPVPELSGSAAQNRFNLLFQKFIAVLATIENPLTIFLDDLQWADSASLNLMKVLMEDSDTGYLLLLGAYRDNEVFPGHPLMLTLSELEKNEATISKIVLEPLALDHINQLVAETLSCSEEVARPLGELTYQKTKGNPFFATQFLKVLHQDELIKFNLDLGYWFCDLVKVRDAAMTDDVVEFMAGRLALLPIATQNVLKLAACIGNKFDLETLATVCQQSEEEVAADIWKALQEGLILPISEAYKFFQCPVEKASDRKVIVGYRFLHDRVQQAAYSLIPPERKSFTHYNIGYILLDKLSIFEREEYIFDIVGHLNLGVSLITQASQKCELARLNLLAGQKAKNATAYYSAFHHLKQGINLLPPHSWESIHELTLNLHCEAMQSGYLSGNIAESESLGEIILQKVNNQFDVIKVYETKIQIYITSRQTSRAIDIGLDALAMMGMSLDDIANCDQNDIALPSIDTVADLLEATDPYHLAKMRILTAITSAALISRPDLLFYIVIVQVLLCNDNGYSALAAFTYSWYGALLCVNPSQIDKGYQSGQLAIALLERFQEQARVEKCSIYNMVYTFIIPWKQHARDGLSYLLEGSQNGLDVGDFVYAGYCLENYCAYLFLTGEELLAVSQKQGIYIELMQKIKNDYAANNMSVWRQLTANLLGQSANIERLDGEYLDEKTVEQNWQEYQLGWSLFNLYLAQTILLYYFGNWSEAVAKAELAKKYVISVGAWMPIAIHNFYYSLALLASDRDGSSPSQRKDILLLVQTHQKTLREWAQHAPMNHQHKWNLVEAERQRVLGNKAEAIDFYDRAIAGAKENQYIQEEALANELAAKFYLDWGKEKYAALHMQEAYYCYARWGAKAKIEDLETRYPHLLTPIIQRQQGSLATSTIATMSRETLSKTTTGTGEMLDLATLMKASRTLSEKIELEGAIANLMQVARENAGAQTIALMLFEEKVLMLVAKVTGEELSVINRLPVKTSKAVPLRIVNQVKRTQQPIVLENATQETAWAGDPYIQDRQPLSILCLPLVDLGQLIGILYLENNQCTGAFTRERVEILNLLCSQAAIALENAKLYQQAQQALRDLQQAQLQLVQSEKMSVLGNLVAGVAHEINNPTGFLQGNIQPARDYVEDLLGLINLYRAEYPQPSEAIQQELETIDLEFIREDLPNLLESMNLGVKRIRHISNSLRIFSRKDEECKTSFNIHEGIDSTLLILKHRTKGNENRPAIKISKDYADIPEVQCFPGQLNQVFMNILANAIDAFDDANLSKSYAEIEANPNCIAIKTLVAAENKVQIQIRDNGCGMKPETVARIFEQGFTTKGVGKGTGLGMAIARQIMVEKHEGTITCSSELGKGTEFILFLPLGRSLTSSPTKLDYIAPSVAR